MSALQDPDRSTEGKGRMSTELPWISLSFACAYTCTQEREEGSGNQGHKPILALHTHLGSLTSCFSWTCCPLSKGITFQTSFVNTRASPVQNDTIRLSLSTTVCTKPTLLCFAPCQPCVGVMTVLLNFTQSPTSNLNSNKAETNEICYSHETPCALSTNISKF